MADILQFRDIVSARNTAVSGVRPALNQSNLKGDPLTLQTQSLSEIRDLQQDSLSILEKIEKTLFQSLVFDKTKERRDREQNRELQKELKNMTPAANTAGLAGGFMVSGGDGEGGDGEDGDGGSNGFLNFLLGLAGIGATTSIAKTGITSWRDIKSSKTSGTSGKGGTGGTTPKTKTSFKTSMKNLFNIKNIGSAAKASKFLKFGGPLAAIIGGLNIAAQTNELREAEAMGADEETIRAEREDVGQAYGSTTGSLIGGVLGAPLGPLGVLAGGVLGGIIGDFTGGLIANSMSNKEKKEQEFKEAVSQRISIPLSKLKGRGFPKRYDPLYFGKGTGKTNKDKWLVYSKKDARSSLGAVTDPDVIAYLNGEIDEIPNVMDDAQEAKDFQKDSVSQTKKDLETIKGFESTYDLTDPDSYMNESPTDLPKTVDPSKPMTDAELAAIEENTAGNFLQQSGFVQGPDLYSVTNVPPEIEERAKAIAGEYKWQDKAYALNAKRLALILPGMISSLPPMEIEKRGDLQTRLNEALDYLDDPRTKAAMTEGETWKDKVVDFFSSKEDQSARQMSGTTVVNNSEYGGETNSEFGQVIVRENKKLGNSILNNLLADTGDILESVLVTADQYQSKDMKDKYGRIDLYAEKLKGTLFGGDTYRMENPYNPGEMVEIDEKYYDALKNLQGEEGATMIGKAQGIIQGALNLQGKSFRGMEGEGQFTDIKPIEKAYSASAMSNVDGTSSSGSVTVNNSPITQNTTSTSSTSMAGKIDTNVDTKQGDMASATF